MVYRSFSMSDREPPSVTGGAWIRGHPRTPNCLGSMSPERISARQHCSSPTATYLVVNYLARRTQHELLPVREQLSRKGGAFEVLVILAQFLPGNYANVRFSLA
ncbi:hypothetical protein C8Q80DRAFT_715413 [Daedaleopsis nitida]|nr:hypothetical protein C8Q80DRAFT_715413 [Daedaleopsis nitida]